MLSECQWMQWLSWRNPCLYLTWFLAEGGGLLCVGRLVFQKKTAPTPELATGGLQVATNFGISWAETWVNSKSEHCMAQKTWPGNGPPKDALAMSWVDTEMHQDILWLGPHIPASLVSNRFVLEDIAACTAPLARCFFFRRGQLPTHRFYSNSWKSSRGHQRQRKKATDLVA